MANDLIGFGNDITKVRAQIPENLEVIYSPAFKEDLKEQITNLLLSLEITPEHLIQTFPFLSQLDIDLTFDELVEYLKMVLIMGLKYIKKHPLTVNRFLVWMMELIYAIENSHDTPGYFSTLTLLIKRKHLLASIKVLNTGIIEKSKVSDYLEIFEEEDSSDENYAHYFAYTLRQTSAQKVGLFLEEKRQGFIGDFLEFMEALLIDFEDLIPEKTRVLAQRWLKNQEEVPNTLAEGKMVDDEEPSPPPGYVKIEGRLSTQEIRRFFSFLYRETNGCPSKEPFLSKGEVEELLKFGFCYPEEEPKKKPFSLKVSAKKPIGIIYYAMYLLFEKHRPIWPERRYKSHFARFLKHHFDNFPSKELTVKSSIRDLKPGRLKKDFDWERYFGVS